MQGSESYMVDANVTVSMLFSFITTSNTEPENPDLVFSLLYAYGFERKISLVYMSRRDSQIKLTYFFHPPQLAIFSFACYQIYLIQNYMIA